MQESFVHLHIHSEYSLLDGAIKISELIPKVKEHNMNAVALVDHGYMGGVVKFYKECKKHGIKPILGCESYCSWDPDGIEDNRDKTRDNFHLVLLAKNNQGYKDLLLLTSEAILENFYYKPRIYIPKLSILKGNVIALSACLGGFPAQLALWNEGQYFDPKDNRVRDGILEVASFFEKGDFYLELQDWDDGTGRQPALNELLLEMGEKTRLPFVITTDAHYLNKEDYELHQIMMAMQFGQKLDEYLKGGMVYGPHFWLKPPEEMLWSAKKLGCEEAYWNTGRITDRCDVQLELGKYQQPTFNPTKEEDWEEYLKWKNRK